MEANVMDQSAHMVLEAQVSGIENMNGDEFAFNPLVNKIAFGIARELVAAVRQLEHHVGETVDRRIDSLQIDFHGLARFAEEQRSVNGAVHDQLETLRSQFQPVWDRIDNICRDLGFQHENINATRTTLDTTCARIDAFVDRLDRQADAVRSLHSAWSQRDTELDQIVDGLARLRANPKPMLANEL